MKTCGKPYHDTLGIVVDCSEETPCRDCLLIEVGRLGYLVESLQGKQAVRSVPVAPSGDTIEVLGYTVKNGCSSNSCHVAKPAQGTNGPCRCIPTFVSVGTKIKIIAALRSQRAAEGGA